MALQWSAMKIEIYNKTFEISISLSDIDASYNATYIIFGAGKSTKNICVEFLST